jgi:protein XagA
MKRTVPLFSLILFLLVSSQCFSSGWPRQQRQTYIHLGWSGFSTDTYYAGSAPLALENLSDNSFAFYGEYGYSEKLTGTVRLPGFRILSLRTLDGKTSNVQAPGDVEAGVRYAWFYDGSTVFSTSLVASFPLGETSDRMGLWTGDGEYNQLLLLNLEHRLASFPAFAALTVGFNNRNAGYSDEFLVGARIGVRTLGPVSLSVLLHAVEPLNNGSADYTGGNYGFATNRQRYLQFGPELTLDLMNGFGMNLAALAITRTENVASAVTIRGGIFFTLDGTRSSRVLLSEAEVQTEK